MTFRNEINDFIGAMQAGSTVVENIKTRKRAEEELAWRKEDTALQRQIEREKYDTAKEQFDRNFTENTRRYNQDFDYTKTQDETTRSDKLGETEYQHGRDTKEDEIAAAELARKNAEDAAAQAKLDETARIAAIEAAIQQDPTLVLKYGNWPYTGKQPPGGAPATALPTPGTGAPATSGATSALPPANAPDATGGATVSQERADAAKPPDEPLGGPEDARRGATVKAEEAGPGPEPGAELPTAAKVGAAAALAPAAALGVKPETLAKALHGGLQYLQEHFGLGGGQGGKGGSAVPGGEEFKQKAERLNNGEAARSPEEDAAVGKAFDEMDLKHGVDPKAFTAGQRKLRELAASYEIFSTRTGKGDMETSQQIAAGIIQLARQQSAMLGMQAEKQIQNGDIQGGAKTVVKAYDLVPDGYAMDYDDRTGDWVKRDETTGEVVAKGKATPEMVLQAARGIQDGGEFYNMVMERAQQVDKSLIPKKEDDIKLGGAAPGSKKDKTTTEEGAALEDTGEPQAASPTNIPANVPEGATVNPETLQLVDKDGNPVSNPASGERSAHEYIDDELAQQVIDGNKDRPLWPKGMQPQEVVKMMGPENMAALKNLANSIKAHNPELTEEESAKIAMSITDPEGLMNRKPGQNVKVNFKMHKRGTPNDPNGVLVIRPEGSESWITLPASDSPRIYDALKGMERLVRGGADVRLTGQEQATTNVYENRKLNEGERKYVEHQTKQQTEEARKEGGSGKPLPYLKQKVGAVGDVIGTAIKEALPTSQPKKVTEEPRMISEPTGRAAALPVEGDKTSKPEPRVITESKKEAGVNRLKKTETAKKPETKKPGEAAAAEPAYQPKNRLKKFKRKVTGK